jgi:hypothetical protein
VAVVIELNQLGLMDSTDTELTLDSRDQRRALEESSGQGLKGLGELLLRLDGVVEAENADVLLTSSLLRLDQAGGTVNADNQASSNLGIKSSTVTSLLDTENAADPSDNLVRRRVGGLVQVDDTVSIVYEIKAKVLAKCGSGDHLTSSVSLCLLPISF